MEEVKKLCIFPDDYGMSRRCFSSCVILHPKIIHKLLSGELDLSWDSCRRSFPDSRAEQEKVFLKSR